MTSTIYASFRRRTDAQSAVDDLVKQGFKSSDIHLVAIDPEDDPYGSDSWSPPGHEVCGEVFESEVVASLRCRSLVDAASGALKGGLVGFIVGLLASVRTLYVPGVGFLSEGGASLIAMSGVFAVTTVGLVIGGILGYFSAWDTASQDEDGFNGIYSLGYGDTIVSVKLHDEALDGDVRDVLSRRRAIGVNSVNSAAYMS